MQKFNLTIHGRAIRTGIDQADGPEDLRCFHFVVMVTDEEGQFVTGLTQKDFAVFADTLGGFDRTGISFFSEVQATLPKSDLPGIYQLVADKVSANRGSDIFAVVVTRRAVAGMGRPKIVGRGQSLVTVIKQSGAEVETS